jgi:4-amino-4-deoxy-L-arabinose transferase-like glycosyltransferase
MERPALSRLVDAPASITRSSRVARRRSATFVLAIPLALTVALRLTLSLALPTVPAWDGEIYARAADDIARGAGFTRAALAHGQPAVATAFYPVGLPAVLAPLHALGLGLGPDRMLQLLLGASLTPIAYLLTRRAAGRRAAMMAAWLAALWPGGILLSLTWMTEPLFSALTGVAVVIVAWSRRAQRARAFALAALVLGLATYVRPTALPILVALALGLALVDGKRGGRARLAARNLTLALVIAGAVLAPWSYRNASALGSASPLSSNGGLNLLIGTLGEGSYDEVPADVDCSRALGEVQKDRCRMHRALERIGARPIDAIARGVLKLTHTFGHESAPADIWASSIRLPSEARQSARLWALAMCRAFWLVLLIGAALGALLRARRAGLDATAVALFAPILATAVLHAATIGGDRYHAHLVVALVALAGLALDQTWAPRPRR